MTTNRDRQLASLLRQHEELSAKIDEIRDAEKAEAIEQIRALMATYEITLLEIEGRKRPFKARGPRKKAE
ncbi:hypothetical protein DPV79_16020 [Burkholderia reimsis]|uniref:H-NS histone family protein n=1 Tax=Burkholderia reimsis TaxID=2234132 RepID=A0A365QUR3_9BURK|nr:H-NS family nucleoid-associated regulatory protein [Burkholderia reimsis]RBB38886.1 hypothetical protein DPV79_16020 [Burkholderia reimsis]